MPSASRSGQAGRSTAYRLRPMSRWSIDSDASRFRITFQPGLPGVGMSIRGITGTFVADIDEDGRPDLDRPVEGEFEITAHDLDLGHPILGRIVRAFLDGDEEVAAQGWINGMEAIGGGRDDAGEDRYRFRLRLHLRGHDHDLDAEGTTQREPDGSITVHGTATVDPRDLGVPIPRFIPLRCLSTWELHVVPAA